MVKNKFLFFKKKQTKQHQQRDVLALYSTHFSAKQMSAILELAASKPEVRVLCQHQILSNPPLKMKIKFLHFSPSHC
jgi:hypothetical protein